MNAKRAFIDANVILYAFSDDRARSGEAVRIMTKPRLDRVVSTQTIGEFINVARKKIGLDWDTIQFHVDSIREAADLAQVTSADQDRAFAIAGRYKLQWRDSQMIATALRLGADVLYTEDMQDGLKIDGMKIQNPFR